MLIRGFLARRASKSGLIAPFDEPAADLPLLGRPLRDFQDDEARRAGLGVRDVAPGEPLPDGTMALIEPDTVFTAETLEALIAASRAGAAVQAAINPGTALFRFATPLSGHRDAGTPFGIGLYAGDARTLADDARARATLTPVCDERGFDVVRLPPYGRPPHELHVPQVSRFGGRLRHWLHVLNFNQALLVTLRMRERVSLGANVKRGKVRIHPNALVEGSILESGVSVDADASVIDSYLGEGVSVGAHAVVHGCVIGAHCHTLIDTHLRRVVAMSGSTLSNVGVEDLLFGRDIFITTGVAFFTGRRGENAVVDGEDTHRPLVTGAIGHRTILGARALFGETVAVPSGTVIVMRPDEGATRLDDNGLARAHMRLGDPAVDV